MTRKEVTGLRLNFRMRAAASESTVLSQLGRENGRKWVEAD